MRSRRGGSCSTTPAKAAPEEIPIDVIYEDEHLAVVNKPAGMVVHPSPGHHGGTLVNALLFRLKSLSGVGGVERPGIVHRLDKETSGLLVVSKDDRTHVALSTAIKTRAVKRVCIGLVHGSLRENEGRVETLYGRHPVDRKRFTTRVKAGRRAALSFRVVERLAGLTLVECVLETGRTHQIRVQMSECGHPIVGDVTYGGRAKPPRPISRHFLHARRLELAHPISGVRLVFEAPLPAELREYIEALRAAGGGGKREDSPQRHRDREI